MKSVGVSLPYLLIAYLEVRPLLRRGRRKEAVTVGVISALGILYACGVLHRWPIPNPAAVIEAIYLPLANWVGMR